MAYVQRLDLNRKLLHKGHSGFLELKELQRPPKKLAAIWKWKQIYRVAATSNFQPCLNLPSIETQKEIDAIHINRYVKWI